MGGRLPAHVAAARRGILAALAGWRAAGCPGSTFGTASLNNTEYDDAAAAPHAAEAQVPASASAPATPAAPAALLAVSGGADSLALAAAAAFLAGKGQVEASVLVVDHGLQPGSAEAAEAAGGQVRGLGLDVRVERVEVAAPGSEEQARQSRYAALQAEAERMEGVSGKPVAILTGHTLSDQAEQVLLGLARGSGTRAIAGIPAARGRILRPFLGGVPDSMEGLWRADTEAVCAHEGLDPWHDPTNAERDAARNRVRLDVLPYLESALGPGLDAALARTAQLAAADADYLDAEARRAYGEALLAGASGGVVLRLNAVRALAEPVKRRVLRLAALAAGGQAPTYERTLALEKLAAAGPRGGSSAGPVQLAGHVEAFRVRDGDALDGGHGYAGPVLWLRAAH